MIKTLTVVFVCVMVGLGVIGVFAGGSPDGTNAEHRMLVNRMLLQGVPDSTIDMLIDLRDKPLIRRGRITDGDHFIVTTNMRSGWLVVFDNNCAVNITKIFDVDEGTKK